VFGEVGLLSENVGRCQIIVGTCQARSALCRDVFREVGLVSGLGRRGRVIVGHVFGEVDLESGRVRRGQLSRNVFSEVGLV